MPSAEEITFMDATAQAELVRKGEVTPLELVENAIGRIEALNPKLNAVITPMFDQAREAAQGDLPDGPFRGVPLLVKDLVAMVQGVPMHMGSGTIDITPDHDTDLITRYRQAGFIILGKTNTPELGLAPTTEPKAFGPTRNPWDMDRIAGGSSGGSAAAVASGMVSIAHGNDGGGSIRIPSSCCGLFGLKPTRGRNPLGPDLGDMMSGLVCEHVLTRSVRDSAGVLDMTHGASLGAPYVAPAPERPYIEDVGADPGKLRVAIMKESPTGNAVDAECKKAVDEAAKLCESLGHTVEEAAPPIDGERFTQAFIGIWSGGCKWTVDALEYATGDKADIEAFEPLTQALYEMGKNVSASDYLMAVAFMQQVGLTTAHFFGTYDIWITPTLGEVPLSVGELPSPPDNPAHGLYRAAQFVPFTPIANGTGIPAMSVPLHWSESGLPVGVQVMAPFGAENLLFQMASQFEEAMPWADKRPPVA